MQNTQRSKLKEKMDNSVLHTNQIEYVGKIDLGFLCRSVNLRLIIDKLFKEVGRILRGVAMLRKFYFSLHIVIKKLS